MKKLIVPLVGALMLGLGGGSAFTYVRASKEAKIAAAARADSIEAAKHVADSIAAAQPAPDTTEYFDEEVTEDTLGFVMDSLMTPADSIRAMQAWRASLRGKTSGLADAHSTDTAGGHGKKQAKGTSATPTTAAGKHPPEPAKGSTTTAALGKPAATGTAPSSGSANASTRSVAEAVRAARNEALMTALPEERIAKIFAQMQARDAARVLEQMDDRDIRAVLGLMGDRQAAAILAALSPARAATISKGGTKPSGENK